MLPLLFIGHGSPMNAIQDNDFTRSLARLGRSFAKPKNIIVISAHWQTDGTWITFNDQPQQVYDFYGFPSELYAINYQPPGNPRLALRLQEKNKSLKLEPRRGIDHGAWAILYHLFPQADIPVIQISLDHSLSETEHFEVAKSLRGLRDDSSLVIASGNIVHNLRLANAEQHAKPFDWALESDQKLGEILSSQNYQQLIRFRQENLELYRLAVPTNEHFLPLLYATALAEADERPLFFHESFEHGSISMRMAVFKP